MSRRTAEDPAWADEVIRRWQRRRDLPFRQLAAAWSALLAELEPVAILLSVLLSRAGKWRRRGASNP